MKRNTTTDINKYLKKKSEVCVAVHQPGYHRYVGYFNKLLMNDIFISFDIVQYVSREWQNRQKFIINGKQKWLTVPVNSGRESIMDKQIVDSKTLRNHWKVIRHVYSKTPYFKKYGPILEEIYNSEWIYLNDLCDEINLAAKEILKIPTPYIRASDFYNPKPPALTKGSLIGDVIRHLIPDQNIRVYYPKTVYNEKTHYLGKTKNNEGFTEKDLLEQRGVKMRMFIYEHPVYTQNQLNNGTFVPYLSIFDLIFNCGDESKEILTKSKGKFIER